MDEQQQIIQLFQLFLQFLTFINSNLNQSIYFLNNERDISLYYNFEINIANQSTKDYILVIEFIQNKQLDPQDFYSKFNKLDSNNMVHDYEYPLNGGICWNCKESFHHQCCVACNKSFNFVIVNLFVVLQHQDKKTNR
ncbi:12581_t:CDS:1, partial [Gigaspora rosea]